jgi:hypothetical protein
MTILPLRKLFLFMMKICKIVIMKTVQGCKPAAPQTTFSRGSKQAFKNLRELNRYVYGSQLNKYEGLARHSIWTARTTYVSLTGELSNASIN